MSLIRKKLSACAAWLALALALAAALAPAAAQAQAKKDRLVVGMALEPAPGLDPTTGAASAIAEVTLYNVYETLTKIGPDGGVAPLLAERWSVASDLKTYTFRLRRDAWFHNGEPLDSAAVKYSFERAAGDKSTNKDRRVFRNMAVIGTPDAATVVITLKTAEPDFLFLLGQATAAIVEPKSAPTNAAKPVGTGPYKLESWAHGASIVLAKWPGWRNAAAVHFSRVTFRFISDPSAQVAALLSGDVDAFPRVSAARSLEQFRGDARFQVLVGGSRAKTVLAMNNKHRALDDVRVRRAIAAAIDRKVVIEAAADGYGVPIGSHYVPGAPGYVDATGINPYDVQKAKSLLKDAGVALPLELSLKLPPPPYARQGGEVIAAQLAKVGIVAKIENVEWAQWLSGVYANHDFDLTLISHVEPFDLGNYAKPDYYWGYDSPVFNKLYQRISETQRESERLKLLGDAQRLVATDAVNVFLYQPQWITVANRHVKGLWKDMPVFVNDLAALSWQ